MGFISYVLIALLLLLCAPPASALLLLLLLLLAVATAAEICETSTAGRVQGHRSGAVVCNDKLLLQKQLLCAAAAA
jgi:hypothetical protein